MHGGFEYVGQQWPAATGVSSTSSTTTVAMYGVNSGMTVGISRHLGVRLDVGYARSSNVFDSGHHSDILSYLAGPVLYPVRTRNVSPYAELLLGGARVTGAVPDGAGGFYHGYANQFAWAGGGGFEIHTSREFAMRVGADYLRTRYFDSTAALTNLANIRGVVSFTYYLGGRRR